VKTYVFDAAALFAFLENTSAAAKVSELIKEANHRRAEILMSAVNYGEAYGSVLRVRGLDRARAIMSAVRALPIFLMDATPLRAIQAADLKLNYRMYYADSFAAALAIEHKATLVTSDSDFKKLGHGFPVLWLKN
jgi:predicted nucleic acid-binding protein